MRLSSRMGELSTASLLVSIVSGFAVAYQYEVADPFVASVAIEAVLPFGAFWRALHFWASQAFFLLVIIHAWQSLGDLPRLEGRANGRTQWVILSLALPMALLALFTGYVLRWDGTGQAAGTIAEHLLLEIPLVGAGLNRFLMATRDEGLNRVYALHVLLTVLLWGIGTWYHTRKVILRWRAWRDVLVASVVVALAFHAPIDLPGENLTLIQGPWFFIGIQEFLRHASPLVAGVLYPLIPPLIYAGLPWARNRRPLLWLLSGWFVSYGGFSLVGWLR